MRRLLWRVFSTYLVLIVLCSAATGLYAWWAFRDFFIAQAQTHLRQEAELIRDRIHLPADLSNLNALETLCQRTGQQADCRVTLILPDGRVVAESNRDPESMENHADRPEIRQVLAGGAVGVSRRHSYTLNQEMLYVAVPVRSAGAGSTGSADSQGSEGGQILGVLRTAMPLTAISQAMSDLVLRLCAVAGLVIGLGGLLALGISRRLSRAVEVIRRGAQRFARGELGHRLHVSRTEEFTGLADALNQMAGQLGEKIRTVTEQKTRQEAILASMSEGVVAVDLDSRVLSLNEAAARLFSIDAAAAANRSLTEVIRNSQLEKLVGGVLAGGGSAEAELSLRVDPEDGLRTVRVNATPLRDPDDRSLGALLVLNDVTQLRRLERVRQDFVANVSHELKTPITSIKGFVETLRDGAVNQPEEARHFLEIIAKQADRLNSIIEDLLSLSRIEQEGKDKEIPLTPGAIEPVLRQAIAACQVAADAKQISMQVRCPANLSARINAPLLEQAVGNLLDNAIKYSERGQAVELEATNSGGVHISVRDHGCGIPAEHLPRLFERFYRVDKARSRKIGGTGLGLAIVKHIVSAHGGTVTVVSTPGSGSTFTIHLPA